MVSADRCKKSHSSPKQTGPTQILNIILYCCLSLQAGRWQINRQQTRHQAPCCPSSHFLLETHSADTLPPTFDQLSPHTSHKTKTQQSPVEQETICPFFPYKAKGMGPGGTVRAPHPAGSCRAQAAGGSRLSITSPQGRSPLPCRMWDV